MTFIRTVLGDVEPSRLGVTYAHEHLVIDGGRPVELYPDFLLADVDRAVEELAPAHALGLRAVIDAMPCSAGRNVRKLAEISRRSGVHVVAPTGLHLAKYYDPDGWTEQAGVADLRSRLHRRRPRGHRRGRLPGPGGAPHEPPGGRGEGRRQRDPHEPRAADVRGRGRHPPRDGLPDPHPLHGGLGALDQLRLLADEGVDPRHVTLSHTDKVVDRGYHRELLGTGAFVEYDQAFRWPDGCPTGRSRCSSG